VGCVAIVGTLPTTRLAVVVWEVVSLFPIVSVYVPIGVLDVVLTVNVAVPDPPKTT
jgi:hypothetical protein